MLRGFWQKVVKALRLFVLRGFVGEGVRERRVVLDRQETGRECSRFAKTEIERKTACCCLRVMSSFSHAYSWNDRTLLMPRKVYLNIHRAPMPGGEELSSPGRVTATKN